MAAPSKTWTAILDATIAAGKALTASLLTAIRNNLVHLEEWLGLSYTAAQDHDHDGVNSKAVAGASLVFLAEAVVGSPVSSVDFTGAVDWTAYDEYFCAFIAVDHADPTNGELAARFSNDGGATFKSGASDYSFSNSEITISGGHDSGGRADGHFLLRPDPGLIMNNGTAENSNSAAGLPGIANRQGGWDYSFGALDGLRFFVNGYNITAGTFRIYGVKRS